MPNPAPARQLRASLTNFRTEGWNFESAFRAGIAIAVSTVADRRDRATWRDASAQTAEAWAEAYDGTGHRPRLSADLLVVEDSESLGSEVLA